MMSWKNNPKCMRFPLSQSSHMYKSPGFCSMGWELWSSPFVYRWGILHISAEQKAIWLAPNRPLYVRRWHRRQLTLREPSCRICYRSWGIWDAPSAFSDRRLPHSRLYSYILRWPTQILLPSFSAELLRFEEAWEQWKATRILVYILWSAPCEELLRGGYVSESSFMMHALFNEKIVDYPATLWALQQI
jgi:hypothetical protein